jgi:hypothetical protein
LEATPAEGVTAYRFSKEDQKRFPDIIQAGTAEAPYYTNSSQVPVEYSDDIFEVLELQDELQRKYTGGTVLALLYAREGKLWRSLPESGSLDSFQLPACRISPSRRLSPFVRGMGIWRENGTIVRSVIASLGIESGARFDVKTREKYESQRAATVQKSRTERKKEYNIFIKVFQEK